MNSWARTLGVGIVCAAVVMCTSVALAQTTTAPEMHTVSGMDNRFAPEPTMHGFTHLQGRQPVETGGFWFVEFDTDSLAAGASDLLVETSPWLRWGGHIRAQAYNAGMLRLFYMRGDRIERWGVSATTLEMRAYGSWEVAPGHTIRIGGAMRQWFVREIETTTRRFELPEDPLTGTVELSYLFTDLWVDRCTYTSTCLAPRPIGFEFEVTGFVEARTNYVPWGPLPNGDDPDVRRNNAAEPIVGVRQWSRGGVRLGQVIRLELGQWASWGVREDDLTRDRLGGTTARRAVPIAGHPRAALLSERYVVGQFAIAARAWAHDFGPFVSVAYVDDVGRTGESEPSVVSGFGARADMRSGPWQVDINLSASLDTFLDDRPQISSMFGFGRYW